MTVVRAQQSMVMTTKDGLLHAAHCPRLQDVTSGDDVREIPNRALIEVDEVNALPLCDHCKPEMPMEEPILLRIPAKPPGPPDPPDVPGDRPVG